MNKNLYIDSLIISICFLMLILINKYFVTLKGELKMIKKFNNEFNMLEYIGNDYYKCPYFYMDYKKYGTIDNKIKIFYQIVDNEVKLAMLNYSTSLHIYSKKLDCDYKELAEFINQNKYKSIFGEKRIIKKLKPFMMNYKCEYGYVRKIDSNISYDDKDVELATKKDLKEIADLVMLDDDLATSYDKDELFRQLKERYAQKFSRNYIIKNNNKIVAHVCTNGEIDKFAIISLVIVHPNHRRKGLAKKLIEKMVYDLASEGKEIYLINYTDISSKLYEKLGFEAIEKWGKLYL